MTHPGAELTATVAVREMAAADDGRLRIAVRLAPAGRGGSAWMHALRLGDEVRVSAPVDAFPLSPGRRPSVLLAGGIGITPVPGLARALRASSTDYRIVYTGRRRSSMPFAGHLLAAHPGRVDVIETASQPRVDADALVASVPDGGVLYVCGSMGLLTEVRAAWQRAGRPPGLLRFETFGTSGSVPARAFRAEIPSRGLSVEVAADVSLLDALEAAGVEVLYDCLRGECGLCRVRVVGAEGAIDHRDVFLSERQRLAGDKLCSCVSRVSGPWLAIEC
jgi:ferredoxin-NADP reductase